MLYWCSRRQCLLIFYYQRTLYIFPLLIAILLVCISLLWNCVLHRILHRFFVVHFVLLCYSFYSFITIIVEVYVSLTLCILLLSYISWWRSHLFSPNSTYSAEYHLVQFLTVRYNACHPRHLLCAVLLGFCISPYFIIFVVLVLHCSWIREDSI